MPNLAIQLRFFQFCLGKRDDSHEEQVRNSHKNITQQRCNKFIAKKNNNCGPAFLTCCSFVTALRGATVINANHKQISLALTHRLSHCHACYNGWVSPQLLSTSEASHRVTFHETATHSMCTPAP